MCDEETNKEVWIHGRDGESPDRQCPSCSAAVDKDLLTEPEVAGGPMLCPECHEELPWTSVRDVPDDDWFNWACLEMTDYRERECFKEPEQRALSLAISLADPRGADVCLEITKTKDGDVLVKVVNGTHSYYPYVTTTVEGSYTVVRFRRT